MVGAADAFTMNSTLLATPGTSSQGYALVIAASRAYDRSCLSSGYAPQAAPSN
jgi:hypothetical protein